MSPTRTLCLLVCALHSSVAYVRSISEDRYPYMIDTDSQKPLDWGSGSLLQHVLGSSAVRVSDNRIRFIPAGWTILQTEKSSTACLPHPEALCVVEGDKLDNQAVSVGHGSRIFPFQDTGVTVHSNTSHSCTHGMGRVCLASPSQVYDVSVCDTVDGSLDVLFTHDRIQLVHININTPLYVLSGIIVVLLIVFVTQNLAIDVMSDEVSKTAVSLNICMILSLILVFCSCMLPGLIKDGTPGLFVPINTQTDLYFFYMVLSYMGVHVSIWVATAVYRNWCRPLANASGIGRIGHLHNVNFMISAILLSIFSTHGTIETVLTTPLLFVFLFRTLFKIYTIDKCSLYASLHTVLESFLVAVDCIMVAATYTVGTGPQAETSLHGISSFCMIFFVAHALAYEANHTSKR
jgi:hypothetical protein